jgi:signal transduction histidine kinase
VLEIALKRAHERISMRRQLRDHTENLEGLVKEKTKKLVEAEKLAAVGQTIAGLSHTIKNIAGALKGGIFVLGKGIELDNKKYLHQGWEMVKGNVDKIKNLSMDLLDYAKITEVKFQLCDPNQPAEEVGNLMAPNAKEHGVDFKLDLAADLTPFYFDPDGIHRCLLNLVANAIDACIDHKSGNQKKEIVLKTVKADGYGVEYQVKDNCCGMAEEVRQKIFQSFFTTKGPRGAGIGLMITKKTVDDHQGIIEVESEEMKGSTFTIKLPEKPQAQTQA